MEKKKNKISVMQEKKLTYKEKKTIFYFSILVLFSLIFVLTTTLYLGDKGKINIVEAAENQGDRTVIDLEDNASETYVLVGQTFQIIGNLSNEGISLELPSGIGFSLDESKATNSGVNISLEGDEFASQTSERTVYFSGNETPIYITLNALRSGNYSIKVKNGENDQIVQINVAQNSLMAQSILNGETPSLPGKSNIALGNLLLGRSLISTFSNPAPPSYAADVNLTDYFAFNGNASVDSVNTNVAVPVPPMGKYQRSSLWSKEKIDLSKNFSMEIYCYFYNSTGSLADGITLTFHNDTTNKLSALGGAGEALGAYAYQNGTAWVRNALSIEFDPYYNSTSYDAKVAANHIAILQPGNRARMLQQTAHNSYGTPITGINFNVNAWRLLTVEWDSTAKRFTSIYYNIDSLGNPTSTIGEIVSNPIDVDSIFGSNLVYWGYTASTGAGTGTYYMAMKKMPEVSVGEISKGVRNVTNNETEFTSEISADNNDTVEYELSFLNNSAYNLTGFTLSDQLDTELQDYVNGSLSFQKYNSSGTLTLSGALPDSSWTDDTFFYNFGTMNSNEKIVVKFKVNLGSATVPSTSISNDFSMSSSIGMQSISNETTINLTTKYSVTEKFIDENGASIAADNITTKKVGETFTNVFPKISGYSIDGYQIDTAAKISANPSSVITLNSIQKDYVITYIYDSRMKVEVRQEIKNTNDSVVVPTKGYITITNNNSNVVTDLGSLFYSEVISGVQGSLTSYTSITVKQGAGKQGILIEPVIPEYYSYVGWSDGTVEHNADVPIQLNYESVTSYSITVYLEPSVLQPSFYGWGYGQSNDYNLQ